MRDGDPLCEAYVQGAIDLETFERFRGLQVAGVPHALPSEVWQFVSGGPPSAANVSAVLREAWTRNL